MCVYIYLTMAMEKTFTLNLKQKLLFLPWSTYPAKREPDPEFLHLPLCHLVSHTEAAPNIWSAVNAAISGGPWTQTGPFWKPPAPLMPEQNAEPRCGLSDVREVLRQNSSLQNRRVSDNSIVCVALCSSYWYFSSEHHSSVVGLQILPACGP